LVLVRHQLQLNNPGPLDVLITALMGLHICILHKDRALDPSDDEISEFLRLPVEGADVPTSWRRISPMKRTHNPTDASRSRCGCVRSASRSFDILWVLIRVGDSW
jgi:hypothetical protein